jgi:hypothetical protein
MPVLLLAAAALALADASIVALALPPIVAELDASVQQAAAVLGAYALVLALALPAAEALRRRIGSPAAAAAGLVVLAAGSLACGLAGSVQALIALRAVQALGAAPLLAAAFALLGGGRAWTAVTVLGAAAGPALGGALTQLLDWRAVFLVQAPLALAAPLVLKMRDAAPVPDAGERPALRHLVALGLLSAALVGVLFLLVLLLVPGLSLSPLAAAAAVSVLPLAALAGTRVPGAAPVRVVAGALLVAGGVGALALLPGASAWWTVPPQVLAGVGMGMALPALAGELLPERTPRDAARLLAVRQAGIVVALALLAPLAAAQLDRAVEDVRLREAAIVLDAKLPPLDKIKLVGTLGKAVDETDPRGSLQRALPQGGGEEAAVRRRADDTLVAAVLDAFAPAFAVCAVLALLAALAELGTLGTGNRRAVAVAAAAALALVAAAIVARPQRPQPAKIADPCDPRALPDTGGVSGALQDAALRALDRAACRFGSSREELALALADKNDARAYERAHGVDPRDAGALLRALTGL